MTAMRGEEQIERLVREHRGLVEHIVDRYTRRYQVGSMEREDLVSWGLIGLYHAARAWDESRCLRFSTLAWKTIERSIIRGVQREWRSEEAQATVSLDDLYAPSTWEEGAETMLGEHLSDPRAEAETRLLDTTVAVRSAVSRLSPAERDLIRQRFYEGRSLGEVGARAGISRQTVHLREKTILRRLRQHLGPDFDGREAA